MFRNARWCLALALVGAVATEGMAQANWTTYGGNDWNQRYSTLAQINTTNVKNLVPRMVFQTGIGRLGSFENTPIVVDNMMYVTTPYNTAMAYDLSTGKEVWRYEHKLGTTIYCCGPNNRGVAVHGPHVYMGTLDARLVSLDRMTGEVLWDIEVADPAFGYSITHKVRVVADAEYANNPDYNSDVRGMLSLLYSFDLPLAATSASQPAPKPQTQKKRTR